MTKISMLNDLIWVLFTTQTVTLKPIMNDDCSDAECCMAYLAEFLFASVQLVYGKNTHF
jgi:hypothetical protein